MRIAVVGFGGIARTAHAPVLQLLAQAGWPIEVVAICDTREEAVLAGLDVFPEAGGFRDVTDLMRKRKGQIDRLLVCSRPPDTVELIRRCLALRCPILVEKPVSGNFEELQLLSAEAASAKARIQVGYNRRFHPALNAFRAEMSRLGTIRAVRSILSRIDRREAVFYEDTSVHPVNLLVHLFGRLHLQTVRTSGVLAPHDIPAQLHAELITGQKREITVNLEIRPSAGEARESIAIEGSRGMVELSFLAQGPSAPAALKGHDDSGTRTLFQITEHDSLPHRLFAQGFLGQMTAFLKQELDPNWIEELEEATRTLVLLTTVIAKIGISSDPC